MARFMTWRIVGLLLVLLIKSFVIFALIGLMPGDPIDLLMSANPNMMPEDVVKLRAIYGVDEPLFSRYANWLVNAVQGDFGFSRIQHRPVLDIVIPALGNTIILTGTAFIISTVVAIILGTLAAIHRGGRVDRLISLLAFLGISVPGFWLGLVFIYLFAVKFGLLPAGGMPRADQPYAPIAYLVLPCLTLVLIEIGGLTRYARSSCFCACRLNGSNNSLVSRVLRQICSRALIPPHCYIG